VTEPKLPDDVEWAIEMLKVESYKAGRGDDDATDGTKERSALRHAIAAAISASYDRGWNEGFWL